MKMKKRVLVADDDAAVRESLKQLLEAAGYQVKLAANGQEAVAVLASHRTDLLLLDLEMPKRDGWDVLLQLSDESSPLRVIVITGLADQLDTRLIDGVGAVIEKPLDPPVLLNR